MTEIKINGKPLAECSDEEIAREHNAGMCWETMTDHWTEANSARIRALEAEMARRPNFGEDIPDDN
jgi:hypothetical protein